MSFSSLVASVCDSTSWVRNSGKLGSLFMWLLIVTPFSLAQSSQRWISRFWLLDTSVRCTTAGCFWQDSHFIGGALERSSLHRAATLQLEPADPDRTHLSYCP